MPEKKVFVATEEAKGKATQLRLFAVLAWLIAIAGEVFAILKLINNDKLTWLIVAIVGILILSLLGSYLWKKANRLDPASEKDKVKFFIQNQLGAIIAVLAFLPLVIFIFTDKDANKKTKSIAGAVAIVGLLVAGIFGVDFNPPSVEKYTQAINDQTDVVKQLNYDKDEVYLAKTGEVYHLYSDCQYIKGRSGVTETTVEGAWKDRHIARLCSVCAHRAKKERKVEIPEEALKKVTVQPKPDAEQ